MNKSIGKRDADNIEGNLKSSLFMRIIILLLILTGIPAWFPAFYKVLGRMSMELMHLHFSLGIILVITCILIFIRNRKKQDFSLKRLVWSGPDSTAESSGLTFIQKIIIVCLLLLIITGPGLFFGEFIPRKILKVLIYCHGAGAFILIPLVIITGFFKTFQRRGEQKPGAIPQEWFNLIPEGRFALQVNAQTGGNESRRFLETFGKVLKYSRIKIFLEDYMHRERCRDIFVKKVTSQVPDEELSDNYGPADYLISIYHKYFTLPGWLQGWFASEDGLTDRQVNRMASLFFGYIPCGNCSRVTGAGLNQSLMARYGKFILGEMGFLPQLLDGNGKKTRAADLSNRETVSGDILLKIKQKLQAVANREVPLTVDKPDSDIVFFPAVHDLAMQSDSFLGLIVALEATGSNWTIGNEFFDGVNYGAFYGDWFIDRVLEKLSAKAKELGATEIVLGGCSGISLVNRSLNITTANGFIMNALSKGELALTVDRTDQVVGYANFCDNGCYLSERENTEEIIGAIGFRTEEIGKPGSEFPNNDHDLVAEILDKKITVLVAPYHNSRERLRFLVKKHSLKVEVCGLYEMLAKIITIDGKKRS